MASKPETIIDVGPGREVPEGGTDHKKNESKTGFDWNLFLKPPPPVSALIMAVFALIYIVAQIFFGEVRNTQDQKNNIENLKYQVEVAELKKRLNTGTSQSSSSGQAPAKPDVIYAKTFDCSTTEKRIEGFESTKATSFTSDVKFLSGCAKVHVDFPVGSLEGQGFFIEYPDKDKPGNSFQCNAATTKCADFLNYIRDGKLGSKDVHIVVKNGGSLTIRR